jgi:hypothetical protein
VSFLKLARRRHGVCHVVLKLWGCPVRTEHPHGILPVARRYPVHADHLVYNDVLVAVQRLLELVAHSAAAVGRVGDAFLHPLNDLDVLPTQGALF